MLEERAGHGGSAAVVWGREGSAGERQQWEVVGGRTAGAGGWWEDGQQEQEERVVVGEHAGQSTGTRGSGMGQREGSAGRGADRAGEQREAVQGLRITVTRRFWHVVLEECAGHGGSASERQQREVVGGRTAGAGGARRGGRVHRAGHGGTWQWHMAEREGNAGRGAERAGEKERQRRGQVMHYSDTPLLARRAGGARRARGQRGCGEGQRG